MDKTEMELAWNGSLIDANKINRFKEGKKNLYKCTMTIFKNVTVDTFTESGYYKTANEAKFALENKLRELKHEKYPYTEGDNKDLRWSFSFGG